MSRRIILAILLLLSFDNCESNGFSTWETVKNYFVMFFRFLEGRIAQVIGEPEMEVGRIKGEEGNRADYKGHQVIRIFVGKRKIVDSLNDMSHNMDGIELWTMPRVGHHADLQVSPDSAAKVKQYLKKNFINFEVMIDDLQKLIASENPKMSNSRREMLTEKRGHPMTWTMYHTYEDIIKYMEAISNSFKNLVEIMTIGYSSEGLPLKVVKISKNRGIPKKTAIWIDGGMHGREWITSSVVLYIVKELVGQQKLYKKLLDQVDWYLMPVANPDGYQYSHFYDRLWKKTRSKSENIENNLVNQILYGTCRGVDLNHNFDFRWGEDESQDDPCSNSYIGTKPFSEPESRAIFHFITNHKDHLKLFITMHSYSQMWLMPSRYATNNTSDFKLVKKMAQVAADAIGEILGNSYGVGINSAYHLNSGGSQEWAREVAGIRYAYQVDLRDRAHYGFILPANQILPTAKEIFTAVKSLLNSYLSTKKPS